MTSELSKNLNGELVVSSRWNGKTEVLKKNVFLECNIYQILSLVLSLLKLLIFPFKVIKVVCVAWSMQQCDIKVNHVFWICQIIHWRIYSCLINQGVNNQQTFGGLEDVLKTCLEGVLKTCLEDLLKILWRQTKYWGYLYTYLGI